MTSILDRIADYKRQEVAKAKQQRPISCLAKPDPLSKRDFIHALQTQKPAVIAEIKKASPSKGIIRADFDVASLANTYATHGASCLSVLTDTPSFQGSPDDLIVAKSHGSLPILRKDFIVDEYQIYESNALGADCILLIVAMLDDQQLRDYTQIANGLEMAVLVESHTAQELERAITLPTPLMGINNRNLHTFTIDLQTCIDLLPLIPDEKIAVAESGIYDRQDIQRLQSHGIHAFLIGEHLMRAPDPGSALQQLLEIPYNPNTEF